MNEPANAQVTFRVPDFVDADGISYSDIEIVVEMNSIHDAARLAETLDRPVNVHRPKTR